MNIGVPKITLTVLITGGAIASILLFMRFVGPGAVPEYAPLMYPNAAHLLGTDNSGRDILVLLIESSGISLAVGIGAALFAVAIGAVVGCAAGYLESPVEDLLLRLTDVFLLIPTLPLVIVLSAYMGPGAFHVAVMISLTAWPATARVIHAHVLKLRSALFITNAKSMGAGTVFIIIRHILPNCSELLLAKAALTAASAMMAEAGISFLGLGDPMHSSWGSMLHDAFSGAALLNGYVWWYLPPVLCISFSVVLFNLAGQLLSASKSRNALVVYSTGICSAELEKQTAIHRAPFLKIRNLCIEFPDSSGPDQPVVNDLNFELQSGEKVAVIGETGSGKSLLLLSVLSLLPAGAKAVGSIQVKGRDLAGFSPEELRQYRRDFAAFVPQALGNALNPVLTTGYQVGERVRISQGPAKAKQAAVEGLLKAGFSSPAQVAVQYPHQLSGGMKQRVLTAMALSNDPDLILADEPTKGLDQEAVDGMVRLFGGLKSKTILAVTHDLKFARALNGRILVMHSGLVIEAGPASLFFSQPLHPYSKALVAAFFGRATAPYAEFRTQRKQYENQGCPYLGQCVSASPKCKTCPPIQSRKGQLIRCWYYVS